MDKGYLFLSYARVDAPLVKLASTLLTARGWKTWVDRSDIPSASDWMSAIRAGIEQADGFVFVMTPHSIASRMCRVELSIATELAKRLLPLMPIDAATWAADTAKINADPMLAPAAEVPAELAKLDYIDLADFVDRPDPFAALMDELVTAASRDLDWLRRHTRLQQDVRRWVDTRYAPSVLLREPLLAEAESMLTVTDKDPALTPLQREFVVTSRTELTRELEREAAQLTARILDLPPERLHIGLMLALEGRERYLASPRLEGALRTLFARWPHCFFLAHEPPVYSIAFNRDGTRFATAATDGVRVVETATGRLGRNWRGTVPATCIAFLGDGSSFAVGWADGRVQIAQLDTQDALEFRIGKEAIAALVQSPDGAHLAAYGGVSAGVIDLRSSGSVRLPPHPGAVHRACWRSADQLVTACEDGNVRVFKLAENNSYSFKLPEHAVDDLAVGAGPAHEVFAAGMFDGLAVLDVDPPNVLAHVPFSSGTPLGLAASDGMERLVMQNVFGHVFVVDTTSRKVVFERNIFFSLAQALTLGPRGARIGAGSKSGAASVTTIDTQREQILAGHQGFVTAIAIDATERRALTAGADATVRLWDIAGVPGRTSILVSTPLHADISADGSRILTASRDGAARLFDRASGAQIVAVPGAGEALRSAVFAANDKQMLLAYRDGRRDFIDVASGKSVRTLQGPPLELQEWVAQTADGRWLLSIEFAKLTRVLDAQSGAEVGDLTVEVRSGIEAEAARRTGQASGVVQIRKGDGEGPPYFELLVRDQQLGVLHAPSQLVAPILSPDGAYVFGAGIDRPAIYVFDSHRNVHIATLPLEHNANGVHVSADGRWLLATWLDRVTVMEFPPLDELVVRVRAQLSRDLTDAERQEFGIEVTAPATAS